MESSNPGLHAGGIHFVKNLDKKILAPFYTFPVFGEILATQGGPLSHLANIRVHIFEKRS